MVLAAGALHALDHHRDRLGEDHRRARVLAEGLAKMPGIDIDLKAVQTNIVRFRLREMAAPRLVDLCAEADIALLASDREALRAVPHLHTTDGDIERVLDVVGRALT